MRLCQNLIVTQYGLPKKRCKHVKACHQRLYKEAVVERWDELKEADPFRVSSEESEAEDDEILIQIEAQERDPTRQSSPVCDQATSKGRFETTSPAPCWVRQILDERDTRCVMVINRFFCVFILPTIYQVCFFYSFEVLFPFGCIRLIAGVTCT